MCIHVHVHGTIVYPKISQGCRFHGQGDSENFIPRNVHCMQAQGGAGSSVMEIEL